MIRVHYAGITVSAVDDSARRGNAGWGQSGCGSDNGRYVEWIASLCDGAISAAERRGVKFTGSGKFCCDFGEEVCRRALPVSGVEDGDVDTVLPEWDQVCGTGCHSDSGRNGVFPSFGESVKGMSSSGRGEHLEAKCLPLQSSLSEDLGTNDGFKRKSEFETKTERNRRWRAERKALKKKRQAMNCDWRKTTSDVSENNTTSSELRETLEKKWKFQNLLAAEKAERDLKVLQASDIEQEKRRYRTKVSAATERNMVSIEKTHAMLRQTGNVSGEQGGGFAETIVSGVPGLDSGSGTISPDSSASMAEFRACQKALLDAEKENQEYKRKIKIAIEKYGFPLEQVDYLDKEIWTDTQTNEAILDELYPNGYGKDTSLFDDGRFRAIGV